MPHSESPKVVGNVLTSELEEVPGEIGKDKDILFFFTGELRKRGKGKNKYIYNLLLQ